MYFKESAIKHVAAGTLKAYADGNMGPFAQKIVEAVKDKRSKSCGAKIS